MGGVSKNHNSSKQWANSKARRTTSFIIATFLLAIGALVTWYGLSFLFSYDNIVKRGVTTQAVITELKLKETCSDGSSSYIIHYSYPVNKQVYNDEQDAGCNDQLDNNRPITMPIKRLSSDPLIHIVEDSFARKYLTGYIPREEAMAQAYFGFLLLSMAFIMLYGEIKKPKWYWHDLQGWGSGLKYGFKKEYLISIPFIFGISAGVLMLLVILSNAY